MGGRALMELRGRTINGGNVEGEAVVLSEPFSFTGDFDPDSGTLTMKNHPLFGVRIAGKILVIPSGKGAVNASIGIYRAHQKGNSPAGIICRKGDPITVECAMTADIPILDSFDRDPIDAIRSGDYLKILGEAGIVMICD
jgi:uncharacterized protein